MDVIEQRMGESSPPRAPVHDDQRCSPVPDLRSRFVQDGASLQQPTERLGVSSVIGMQLAGQAPERALDVGGACGGGQLQ